MTMTAEQKQEFEACRHCGLPSPDGEFCCAGCETAWQIIRAGGWDAYYKVRDPERAIPVAPSRTSYDYLATENYRESLPVREGVCQATWYLNGLRCPACTWLVEHVSRDHRGVLDATTRFSDGRLDLRFSAEADLKRLAESLASLGYQAGLRPTTSAQSSSELLRLGISGALAANLMLMSLPFYTGLSDGAAAPFFGWIAAALSLPLLLYGARPFFSHARIALAHRAISLDLPIALGLSGAFLLSTVNLIRGNFEHIYFDSMGMLVFFLLVGRYIQGQGVRRALRAGRALLDEMPQMVRRVAEDGEQQVPASEIRVGDELILETGDTAPVDGEILSDHAVLNLHVVSGESRPVERVAGESVLAGAINMGPELRLRAVSRFEDSRFAQLEAMARNLRSERKQKLGSRLAAVFLAVITSLALGGLIWWWPTDPIQAVSVALTLFIVACPCAFAFAEPTARAFAWSAASKAGIWLSDESVLDELFEIEDVIYDKTGLLTDGKPTIVDRYFFVENKHWLEAAILTLESTTSHPIVEAFREALRPRPAVGEARDVRVVPGAGVRGTIDGHDLVVAAPNRLDRFAVEAGVIDVAAARTRELAAGHTVVCAVLDGRLAGLFTLHDAVREEAGAMVSALSERGLHQTILSGDQRDSVHRVAEHLGVDAHFGQLLPEEKLAHLTEKSARDRVLMAGDGLNDMGALAAASVAVTHDEASRAAIRFADVVLQGREIGRIASLFRLADVTRLATIAGYTLSLAYNALAITLTLKGLIGPLTAAVLMPLSSLSLIGLIALIFSRRSPWAF